MISILAVAFLPSVSNTKAGNCSKWRFPQIRGTLEGGGLILRIIAYSDLFLGSPYFGKLRSLGARTSPDESASLA